MNSWDASQIAYPVGVEYCSKFRLPYPPDVGSCVVVNAALIVAVAVACSIGEGKLMRVEADANLGFA